MLFFFHKYNARGGKWSGEKETVGLFRDYFSALPFYIVIMVIIIINVLMVIVIVVIKVVVVVVFVVVMLPVKKR